MTCFISGGAKSGKSALAQDLAVALAKGGRHYYVATMISTGSEDDDRIRQHVAQRDGMGFETVECFHDILDCLQFADKDGVFLVDSVTSLIQNSLFPVKRIIRIIVALRKYSQILTHVLVSSRLLKTSTPMRLRNKCLALI